MTFAFIAGAPLSQHAKNEFNLLIGKVNALLLEPQWPSFAAPLRDPKEARAWTMLLTTVIGTV